MSAPNPLPDAIKRVQISLSPFVRQRQEADHIRRVLAVHLSRHIDPNIQDGDLLPSPLSLVLTEDVDISSSGFRGNRKEYVRCVRANIKARKEYSKISREHQPQCIPDIQPTREGKSKVQEAVPDIRVSLDLFLDLVRKRRKHERLRIIQDYVDMLSQKLAASPHHLDLPTVLKDTQSPPQMPPEVLATVGPSQEVAQTDIKDLVDRLERSVLRAKILLQREQKLLAKARDTTTSSVTSSVPKNRLQALGTTRNELINWIETELGKASDDNSEPTDVGQTSTTTTKRNKHIESQVALIWRQYSHYTSARQKLIRAVAEQGPLPITPTAAGKEPYLDEEQKQNSKTTSHITSQYLGSLLCVSNDQKSAIQQKSHLTISMSKQLKEAGQGTDRLAHESHLLPTYPMPPNFHQRKEMDTSISFATEIARNEKPDSSRRARAWVYAAQAADTAMKDAILENLDEGESAVTGASKALSDLQTLLGLDVTKGKDGEHQNVIGDMWAVLDGHLGAIKTDDP